MPKRITEISDEFKAGLWKAEVSKREDGEHVMCFGYGIGFDPNEIYQGNEVNSLLKLMAQVDEFLNEPMGEPTEAEPAKGHDLPPAPVSKEDLIQVLNSGKIKDMKFESFVDEGRVNFSLTIVTEDHRSFIFTQELDFNIAFRPVEILDFTTGNGRNVHADVGGVFDPQDRIDLNISHRWENADMGWK